VTGGFRSFLPGEGSGGDLITVFQYLKDSYKEGGDSSFTRSHMETTGATGTSCTGRGFLSI